MFGIILISGTCYSSTPKKVVSCSEPNPVHFLTFLLILCTQINNIAVKPRSCVLGWSTFTSIQGKYVLIPNILHLKKLSTFWPWIDENVLHPRTHFPGCWCGVRASTYYVHRTPGRSRPARWNVQRQSRLTSLQGVILQLSHLSWNQVKDAHRLAGPGVNKSTHHTPHFQGYVCCGLPRSARYFTRRRPSSSVELGRGGVRPG